jgi:hypothetical protein
MCFFRLFGICPYGQTLCVVILGGFFWVILSIVLVAHWPALINEPSFTFDFQLNMFFLITSLVHVLDFVPAYSLSLLLNYHQNFIFIICFVIKFLD